MRATVSAAALVALVAAVVLSLTLFRGEDGGAPDATDAATDLSQIAPAAGGRHGTGGEASFDVVRVAPDGGAVIAGRTAPGAQVTIRAGQAVIGKVIADERGQWVLVPDEPLPSGVVELSQEVRVAGREPFESEQVAVIVVPERAAEGPREPVLVLRALEEGGASEVLQEPLSDLGGTSTKALSLMGVDYDEEGNLVLWGEAEPGARVLAYIDNESVGASRAGPEGRWRLEPISPIEPGSYRLRLDQVDAEGKVAARLEVPFSRAMSGELALAAGQVVVQPGNSLWRIARAVYGRGVRYSVIYRTNRDQIRDPDLIYPGQVLIVPDAD